jgi:drug/metabolite transporter (DMT)-like permease
MEDKLPLSGWQVIRRWLWITAVFAVFGLMYTWVLIYSSAHTRQGNVVLAVLTGFGAFAVWASVMSVRKHYERGGDVNGFTYGRYVLLAVCAVVIWHIVGASMPTPELQSFFVFAPIEVVGIFAFIGVVYLLNRGAEHNKHHQL